MKKVFITANALGQIFTQSFNEDGTPKLDKNGEPTGFIRVENPSEVDLSFAYNGGVRRGQSALIPMSVKGFEKVKNARGADGEFLYRDGASVKGRVQVVESLTQEIGMQPKTTGGENPQNLTLGGKQIYRKTVFDPTGLSEDVLIQHDNEIIVESKVLSDTLNAE